MPEPSPVVVHPPSAAAAPLLLDSPHSGMDWPADFAPSAPREAILTTWDAFVDELWSAAPAAGATLLAATFPRAYVDVNRAVSDIDAELLDREWPEPLQPTDYTRRGMGLIRRNALPGIPMYDRRLSVAEVQRRVSEYYAPYRERLAELLDGLVEQFGAVWHLNLHSMKSRGNAMNVDAGARRPDFVISDRHGSTAAPEWTNWIADWWRDRGFSVQLNDPYQGGDLVRSFGDPARARHSIQIEINRALYLDEASFSRGPRFAEMRGHCGEMLRELGDALRAAR